MPERFGSKAQDQRCIDRTCIIAICSLAAMLRWQGADQSPDETSICNRHAGLLRWFRRRGSPTIPPAIR